MVNVGQRFGDFEILERLGETGIGTFYKARQVSRDRLVALKTLHAKVATDPEYVARFHRDAKIATELSHPDIVQVYGAGETDGVHWLATEFVEGTTAEARLKRKGHLALPEAVAIATHIATVLDYGWRKAKLIHRDIEPDTIFLSKKSEVKLRGLGLAKSAGEMQSLALNGAPMGAPHYMSPEQAEGKADVDLRADIYSLGCTLFHFISGETPYKGDTAMAVILKHVTTPVPDLHRVYPACPAEVSRVVMKMMHKHPAGRHQSYAELIEDLRRCHEVVTSAPAPAPVPLPAPAPAPEPPPAKAVIIPEAPVAKPAPAEPERPKERRVSTAVEEDVPEEEEAPRGESRRSLKKPLAIASAVLIPSIIALVFFGPWKGHRLTEAERAAREREAAAASGKTPTIDGVPDESALPPATKQAPFVNSLGMTFVPVPITGGPTSGKRVLFSVWETRVEDYAEFARDTKRERRMAPFPQQARHPVVNVSWEDAQAFCKWLTEREQKEGRLHASARYRLPGDHEWSCAVGIGEREDAAQSPVQKSTKIADVYPWGKDWPPLSGSENYCGQEVVGRELLGDKSQKPLGGYRDDFPFTAPVGSLGANRLGLFDLGGNVWEWCEDSFDHGEQERDIRGASFASYSGGRASLLSSSRTSEPSTFRAPDGGFRVVLAIAPSAPPPAPPTPAPATIASATPAPAPVTPTPAPAAPPPVVMTPTPAPTAPQSATGKWLAAQEALWEATFASEVTGPFEKGLADLKTRHLANVEAQLAKTTAETKFDAEALRSELARMTEGREMPAEDDSIVPAVLKALRNEYRAEFARLDAERFARAKSVHARYDSALAQMQASLNVRRSFNEVAEVQGRRDAVRAAWLKPPAGASPAVATAPTMPKPAPGPTVAPAPSKTPKLKPRELVERLFALNATVSIGAPGALTKVQKIADVPGDKFAIIEVEFNMHDGLTEADLDVVEQLTEVETLIFTGVPATDATLKMLRGLSGLRTLRLRELEKLTVAGFRAVAALPSLHSLNVRGPISAESLAAISTNRKLENLSLNDSAFDDQEFGAIASIPTLKNLIISTRGPVPAAAWARLIPMKKLNKLTVENTPKSAEMIAQISKLSELKTLQLGDVTLPDAQLAPLGGLKSLETLETGHDSTFEGSFCSAWALHPAMKTLTLRSTRSVNDKVLRIFATIFPKLERLDVTANAGSVTPAGFSSLQALKKLDHLTFVGDAVDTAALAQLAGFSQLRHLGIGNARIADTDMPLMARLGSLRELDWFNPHVSDVALKSYGKLRMLTTLKLGPATKPEVEGKLKAALPGVKIVR